MAKPTYAWHSAADPYVEAVEPWLLYPLFGSGALTVLIGEAKYAGKSTLVLNLISQMLKQGSFAARSITWAPAVYYTEQSPTSFRQTMAQAGILSLPKEQRTHFHYKHRYEMGTADWGQVVKQLGKKCEAESAKYLVVDTFSGCVGLKGEEENSAGGLIKEKIKYLQDVCAAQDLSVLVTHHARKTRSDEVSNIVNASRGHSALSDEGDILALLRNTGKTPKHPHREIEFAGRWADLPADPLELEFLDGCYIEKHAIKMLDAGDLLYAALEQTFTAGEFNALAEAFDIKNTLAWECLRHWQRELLIDTVTSGEYRKQAIN